MIATALAPTNPQTRVDFSGLPDIFSRAALTARYNPLQVRRMVWLAERWWWQQAGAAWESVIRGVRSPGDVPDVQEWDLIADVAMNCILRVGGLGARKQGQLRRAKPWAKPPSLTLRTVAMADEGDPYGVLDGIDWSMLDGETWDEFKLRVFAPLSEQVYGIPTDFANRYVETRLPPIRAAEEQTRARVADVMRDAMLHGWQDKEIEANLRATGQWPLARVRNQVRTETATMFNAGRFRAFQADEEVVGYEYVVTLDERTTAICQALAGKKVKASEIEAVPPLHYQCRTVLEPIFSFDSGYKFDEAGLLPAPGRGNYMQFAGFGQPELVKETWGLPLPPEIPKMGTTVSVPFVPKTQLDLKRESDNWASTLDQWSDREKKERTKGKVAGELAKRLSANHDWKAFTKSDFGKQLADEGVSFYELPKRTSKSASIVARLTGKWADTSGDSEPLSVAMQLAAQEEFGLTKAATAHMLRETVAKAQVLYQEHGPALRAFMRAQYETTQEWLAAHAEERVTLYRGFWWKAKTGSAIPAEVRPTLEGMADVGLDLQPMNSFSASPDIARQFAKRYGVDAGTVVRVDVRRKDILSTCQTGFGCKSETEFVVLGRPQTSAAISWKGDQGLTEQQILLHLAQAGR